MRDAGANLVAGECALRGAIEAGEVSVALEAGGEDRRERDLIERRYPQGVEDRTAIERFYVTATGHRTRGNEECCQSEEAARSAPR